METCMFTGAHKDRHGCWIPSGLHSKSHLTRVRHGEKAMSPLNHWATFPTPVSGVKVTLSLRTQNTQINTLKTKTLGTHEICYFKKWHILKITLKGWEPSKLCETSIWEVWELTMLDRSLHDTVSPEGVNNTETMPGVQSSTERHRHTLTSRQERILIPDIFFSLYSKNPHF